MDPLTSEMWAAVFSGQYDLAKQLINRGTNVNLPRNTSSDEITSLHHAVAKNDAHSLRLLIKNGANCNARDTLGQTLLHYAVSYPCIRPGDIWMEDRIVEGDRLDVVEVLINEGAVVDARDDNESTPLHRAVARNFNEMAQKLIARGASIEAVDRRGRSILHTAVDHGNLSMVKLLMSHRVNVDAKDISGATPLLLATQMHKPGSTEIVQLLLENGADVNTKSMTGSFPLYSAVRQWNVRQCKTLYLLLKWGAHVNKTTNTGETALHEVCNTYNCIADCIDMSAQRAALLLKFGADLNARNCEGKTPFELLSNLPFAEATARVIIREAIKRETLGQPLCEGYKQTVQSRKSYSEFDRDCREEVTQMQSVKIDIEDRAVSFFYILSMHEEKLAAVVRNEEIVTAFESSGYVASFSIYADELTEKFEVAKKRANFLMTVEDCLVDVLGDMLPALIVRKIAAMSSPAI